jgi:hypothetical protein
MMKGILREMRNLDVKTIYAFPIPVSCHKPISLYGMTSLLFNTGRYTSFWKSLCVFPNNFCNN